MSKLKLQIDAALAALVAPGAPFELVDSPQTGIGSKQYKNSPNTLVDLYAAAKVYGEKEFVLYQGERWTFEKMLQQADSIGFQLVHRYGVKRGSRVAIAMRNYPEWIAAFMAITSIGAVAVPLNSWGLAEELNHGLTDSESLLLFCDQQRYDLLKGSNTELSIVAVIVRPEQVTNQANTITYQDFIAEAENAEMPVVDILADDDALIMYTSGTTGKPKGALSTHRALCQAIFSIECMGTAMAMGNQESFKMVASKGFAPCTLMSVPLFHVSGCHATFLTAIRSGSRIVMMHKWDVDQAFDYVEQEKVTSVGGAPPQILDFLSSPRLLTADVSSLSILGVGGASTPPKLQSLIDEHLPNHVLGAGWGMTETNSIGVFFGGTVSQSPKGSSGIRHPIVELSIRDGQGRELPAGEKGALWVRSVVLIKQYWNRPQANAKDFSGRWFNSGDIGHVDEDGFLYLADRAKDMIIRGGENVYPAEIENCLIDHPDVQECAVFGLAHERLGEEVAVVIVSKPGRKIDRATISAYAEQHLSSFKVPTQIFVSATPLPRNATNKIMKNQIRDQYSVQS
ncbi:MAG: long-chain acyl-CoA synthetase [Neolewinella sp.]